MQNNAVFEFQTLAKPFIELGLYSSTEELFGDVVKEMVENKIKHYSSEIEKFEKKHRMKFSEFSKKLKNKATIKEEDDWLDWESAINMLKAWKNFKKAIKS